MKECPICHKELDNNMHYCPVDGHGLVTKILLDELIGTLIEKKYIVKARIGEGGMGVVYKAVHTYIGSTVALKILNPALASDSTALERFRREAQAAAQIKHPNAVAVTDFGVTAETNLAYLVMEFIDGIELKQKIKDKRLDYQETLDIMRQICSAVQAAHYKGIIHRDLKPENILITTENGYEQVKVLDFGLAKLRSPNGVNNDALTQPGTIVGTPYYMSPEQCADFELDGRSDIYSLGVILYEMLTGEVPFRANTPMAVALKHLNELPRAPSTAREGIPPEIDRVILRALSKKREDRQPSAAALSVELEQAMVTAGLAVAQPSVERSGASQRPTVPNLVRPEVGEAQTAILPPPTQPAPDLIPVTRTISPAPAREVSSGGVSSGGVSMWLRTSFWRGEKNHLLPVMAGALLAGVLVAAFLLMSRRQGVHPLAVRPTPNPTASAGVSVTPAAEPSPPAGMIYIPGGRFAMGSNASTDPGERPEHQVEVGPFFIDKYEVTNEEYRRFLDANPKYHHFPATWEHGKFPEERAKFPVTGITLGEAIEYARWAKKRLPKEEEWEYAARGDDKRAYPWGAEFTSSTANTKEAGFGEAAPVDAYPGDVSPFGIIGMGGNVSEWVDSIYLPYPGSDAPVEPNSFVVRGGNFYIDRAWCTTTHRVYAKMDESRPYLGFRCAANAPQR